jgi:hypothetical protein
MFLLRRNGVASSARLRAASKMAQKRVRGVAARLVISSTARQFDTNNYFEVTGSHTGRRYRVHYGTMSNVVEVDADGQPATGWCFVPERALAPGDVMLAQKIALETDEAGVLALAHRFSPRPPSLPRAVRRAY